MDTQPKTSSRKVSPSQRPTILLALFAVDAALIDLALMRMEDDVTTGLLQGSREPTPLTVELLHDVVVLRARIAHVGKVEPVE